MVWCEDPGNAVCDDTNTFWGVTIAFDLADILVRPALGFFVYIYWVQVLQYLLVASIARASNSNLKANTLEVTSTYHILYYGIQDIL